MGFGSLIGQRGAAAIAQRQISIAGVERGAIIVQRSLSLIQIQEIFAERVACLDSGVQVDFRDTAWVKRVPHRKPSQKVRVLDTDAIDAGASVFLSRPSTLPRQLNIAGLAKSENARRLVRRQSDVERDLARGQPMLFREER
ncbi:hypothetical protein ACNJYD_08815 [Bradyrhizobium sp. DASA03005]|uniref:hypothetical protein n=1 Tax=Bradyrhizobium sp. SPXBL-02 TaxID=3395912 RepID=UPI003F721A80